MRKFATIGAACLAVVLAAATPALARGGHGGGGFHGGGVEVFTAAARTSRAAALEAVDFVAVAAESASDPELRLAWLPAQLSAEATVITVVPATMTIHMLMTTATMAPTTTATLGGYDNGYAARNGFVCQPGTWFRGEDGRRHLCQ